MRVGLLFVIGIIAVPLAAQEKPRVWIAPNAAWRINSNSTAEIENRAVELSSTFARSCKDVIVNADLDKANYVVEINRRFKYVGIDIERTDVAIYRWNADLVGGASKGTLGAAVKAACGIMKKDWPEAPRDLKPRKRDDKAPVGQTTSLQQ